MRAEERGRDDDLRVNEIVSEYVDRMNAGERITAELVLREESLLAGEILDALQVFFDLDPKLEEQPLGTLGDYTLRRQIGRGGMGVVYEAWQNSLDRQVALKVLPPGVAADAKRSTRFLREAQIVAKLSHPQIVPVFATGIEGGTPWYAMEFVEGETLAQVLVRIREAKPDEKTAFGAAREELSFYANVAKAFADVADGLQHAHSKGIIHRDIKPSNLILDKDGRLRILDFGLARFEGQESLTISGDLVGTPRYMSPEQARRKKIPVDHRTDVYSLGATLYEMLTLQPPFRGRDHEDTLSQIIERDPVEPRKVNPRVPKDLETIVLKCLRKEAGDRYGTAEATGQDLRRFVRGDAVEARPEARWDKARRWAARHRLGLSAAGALIVLAFGGLTVAMAFVMDAYETATEERNARERELYVSDMRLAMITWQAGSMRSFEEILERHRPTAGKRDPRGWEWHYMDTLRRQPLRTIQVDPDGVHAVAWSPDGTFLAAAGASGEVSLWSDDRKLLQRMRIGDAPVRGVAWSPDGQRVAGVDQDGVTRGWLVATGTEFLFDPPKQAVPSGHELRAISWSPDGKFLAAAAGDGEIRVRDGWGGSPLGTLSAAETDCVPCLAWSPDARQLAACFRGFRGRPQVVIWESASWRESGRIPIDGAGFLFCMAWSRCGKLLSTGSDTGEIRLWDAETCEQLQPTFEHSGHVFGMTWSPDSTQLASVGSDGLVKLWRPDDPKALPVVLRGHRSGAWSVDWSAANDRVASAGSDGALAVWDPTMDTRGAFFSGASYAVWSRDGRWLAGYVPAERVVHIRDSQSAGVVASVTCTGGVHALSFHPGRRLIAAAAADDLLWVSDWQRGVELARVEGRHGGAVECVEWSPDGRSLASGGQDGLLRIRDGASFVLAKELPAHSERIGAVAWSANGTRLASASIDLGLKIWDVNTWRIVHDLKVGKRLGKSRYLTLPRAIAWSPDGSRIAATVGLAPIGLVVLDASTGEEVFRAPGHISGVTCVAWSPDGRRLATGGYDRTIKLWDTDRFTELVALEGHSAIVNNLAWHPDGLRLLSGANEGTRVWAARGWHYQSNDR